MAAKTATLNPRVTALFIFSLTLIALIISGAVCIVYYFPEWIGRPPVQERNQKQVVAPTVPVGKAVSLIQSAIGKMDKAQTIVHTPSITESEKKEVSVLIASAIQDAKQATWLEPHNSEIWFNMGNIYAALLDTVQDADTWAIKSYRQAIVLDGDNHLYYEKLGGVYYRTGKYVDAAAQFEKITILRPAYANGYYNLGMTYKKLNRIVQAKSSFERTLQLLAPDSPDRKKIEQELTSLSR